MVQIDIAEYFHHKWFGAFTVSLIWLITEVSKAATTACVSMFNLAVTMEADEPLWWQTDQRVAMQTMAHSWDSLWRRSLWSFIMEYTSYRVNDGLSTLS